MDEGFEMSEPLELPRIAGLPDSPSRLGDGAGEVTQLLVRIGEGDRAAEARLFELVNAELKRIAAWHLQSERAGHSLQPTMLVNEAYLQLAPQLGPKPGAKPGEPEASKHWKNRGHFFAVAAQLMRRILVDHARARRAAKRGGGRVAVELTDALAISEDRLDEILALDEALDKLAAISERKAKVVELRFIGGLTENEVARLLDVDPRTVKRDWEFARAWLYGEMGLAGA